MTVIVAYVDGQISYFGLMEEGISFANNEYVNINLKIAGK
jgi:hypothetical protein